MTLFNADQLTLTPTFSAVCLHQPSLFKLENVEDIFMFSLADIFPVLFYDDTIKTYLVTNLDLVWLIRNINQGILVSMERSKRYVCDVSVCSNWHGYFSEW